MLARKQILVPTALDKKIRRLAQKRGISQSASSSLVEFRTQVVGDKGKAVIHGQLLNIFAGEYRKLPRESTHPRPPELPVAYHDL